VLPKWPIACNLAMCPVDTVHPPLWGYLNSLGQLGRPAKVPNMSLHTNVIDIQGWYTLRAPQLETVVCSVIHGCPAMASETSAC
jgi:hypothetical protein